MSFVYALTHYFYPAHSNNQKAKLVHSSTLVIFTFVLIAYQIVLRYLPYAGVQILGYAANIPVAEVVNLTNQKRTDAGLSTLTTNPLLEQAARAKGEDMLASDYWAHVSPSGTEPWGFFLDAGYTYRYAGENLARDFSNANSAVDAWMASPSHRDNMLSSKYSEVGIAVIEGDLAGVDTTLIVQLFGTRLEDTTSSVPVAEAKAVVDQNVAIPTTIPTLAPTSTPAVEPTPTTAVVIPPSNTVITSTGETGGISDTGNVVLSPFSSTKALSIGLISVLIGVLAVDIVVVARKRIPRVSGRTFAHLSFFGMILAIVLIARAGEIL